MPHPHPIPAPARIPAAALLLLATACLDAGEPTGTRAPGTRAEGIPVRALEVTTPATIHVDPATTYQTITGWEATAYVGENTPRFLTWRDRLADSAVLALGINRLRLELRSGSENDRDWYGEWRRGAISDSVWKCARYATRDDGGGPAGTNPAGFKWTQLDSQMVHAVLPIRQRLAARGERLYLSLTYVSFEKTSCPGHAYGLHHDPAEYAEFVLAAFDHLRVRHGVVPDAVEVILEPDNSPFWASGRRVGAAAAAVAARLRAAGHTPAIIAPSTASMSSASLYFDSLARVPGALEAVTDLAYHRYAGVSSSALRAIATRATQHRKRSAMLERIGATQWDLVGDLTTGNASAWQQFALGGPGLDRDNGARYFLTDPATGAVVVGSRTRHLRHYFRWVRAGAVRVKSTSSQPNLVKPVAFRNPDGTHVLVLTSNGATPLVVSGLPSGRYALVRTTASETMAALPTATVAPGGALSTALPAAGTMTIREQRP